MSNRCDALIAKHPDHAEAIRELAARDPAGNLKYIQWELKILLAKQALAPEIADVVELFHRFVNARQQGAWRRDRAVRPDLYSYKPHEFTGLRDTLFKLRADQRRKQAKVERRYRIIGECDAEVVYETDDVIVRMIKNKNASVHYGLGTKWCIAMKKAAYYEEYDAKNTIFFFIARKKKLGNPFDVVAAMYERDGRNVPHYLEFYDAVDSRTNNPALAEAFGAEFFDIQRHMYVAAMACPGSLLAILMSGAPTSAENVAKIYETVKKAPKELDMPDALLGLSMNASTPSEILVDVAKSARTLLKKGARLRRRIRIRRRTRRSRHAELVADAERDVHAAVMVNVNCPPDLQAELHKSLRQRNVRTESIRTSQVEGYVQVSYEPLRGRKTTGRRYYRYYRRNPRTLRTPTQARNLIAWFERRVHQYKKRIVTTRKRLREIEKKVKKAAAAKALKASKRRR